MDHKACTSSQDVRNIIDEIRFEDSLQHAREAIAKAYQLYVERYPMASKSEVEFVLGDILKRPEYI